MEWWTFKETVLDCSIIAEFEKKCEYEYSEPFKEIAVQFDGGTPEYMEFDTDTTEGRVLNNLLSFRQDKSSSVWMLLKETTGGLEWSIEGLDWRYIPFARDPFGNYICFDRTNDHIVFWDHETGEVEEVADTFTVFINSLYESDE